MDEIAVSVGVIYIRIIYTVYIYIYIYIYSIYNSLVCINDLVDDLGLPSIVSSFAGIL